MVTQQLYQAQQQPSYGGYGAGGGYIDEAAKQRYIEEEKQRLRMYEEQRRQQAQQAPQQPQPDLFNPFGAPQQQGGHQDLLNLFDTPRSQVGGGVDPTNPFAASLFQQPAQGQAMYPPVQTRKWSLHECLLFETFHKFKFLIKFVC